MVKKNTNVSISMKLLILLIRKNWIKLVVVSFIFALISGLLSFFWPKEFESSVLLLPENSSNTLDIGSLSGLANLAGVNIGDMQNTTGISIKVYPKIINSSNLNLKVLNSSIYFENDSISVKEYFSKLKKSPFDHLRGLIETIRSIFRSKSQIDTINMDDSDMYLHLSVDEYAMIDELRDRVTVSYDQIEGVFNISAKVQDAFVAAQILDKVIFELEKKLTEHKTNKELRNALFVKEQMDEAESVLTEKTNKLSIFKDQNRNKSRQSLVFQEKLLVSEYNLAFEIYSSLAKQYAQSLIKVEESKPEFVYLDDIKVPVKRESPKRALTAIIFFFLGFMLSTSVLVFKNYKELLVLES